MGEFKEATNEHSIGTFKIAQNIAFEHKMLIEVNRSEKIIVLNRLLRKNK